MDAAVRSDTLRKRIRTLYEGDVPAGHRFRYALLIFDLATIAFVIATMGIELQALALLQHLMGVATAVLTYLLGRQLFNRTVGLVSGLLTAVAAPLLVYEQHVMSETLFAFTLALAAVAFVWAAQRLRWWQLLLAGSALGLAALARPIAQGLLPLVPLALLVSTRSWRQTLRATVLVLVGAVNIPIIKFSVEWWYTLHQGESVFRMGGSTIDPSMLWPLLVMALAFTGLFFTLHLMAMRAEILRRRIRTMRLMAAAGVATTMAPAMPAEA